MEYEVLFKCSPFDNDEDDLTTAIEFETKEEALECFNATPKSFYRDCPYIALAVRKEIVAERTDKTALAIRSREDRAWTREVAMEAGMLGGCESFNDAMGY